MVELTAIKFREGEQFLATIIPLEGKMQVEDLAALLELKTTVSIKEAIKAKKIKHHKVGGKTIVDLESFWAKTAREEW